jgi:hypothetical protein
MLHRFHSFRHKEDLFVEEAAKAAMEEFFKEMTTPIPFHENNLYTNEELKLMN